MPPAGTQIEAWAHDERVVAIGETGLDSDRLFSPWEAQLANLRRNLALALATGKPAILHCRSKAGERDAQDALVRELHDAGFDGPAGRAAFGDRPPAVIHSFSGPVDYAREMLAMGLAISFSGLVFRRGEEASADVARAGPGGSPAGRDRRAVPVAAGRPARPQRAGVRGDHGRAGSRSGAGSTADELGDGLVAAYDARSRGRSRAEPGCAPADGRTVPSRDECAASRPARGGPPATALRAR